MNSVTHLQKLINFLFKKLQLKFSHECNNIDRKPIFVIKTEKIWIMNFQFIEMKGKSETFAYVQIKENMQKI